jgi:G:T/U-mismatch repair DNA glycosylase
MIETNPFRYFIPSRPKKLIIGSFPCYNGSGYGDWYYSGSGRNHFWKLLSDLTGMPVTNLDEKKQLCEKFGIALTDIAYRIERKKNNCSDANLRIIEFNTRGIEKCLRSGVSEIFFTGRFVEKHFNRLFPENDLPKEVLISPSPAANMHIGGLEEFKKLISGKSIVSPYEYRLRKYREILMKK